MNAAVLILNEELAWQHAARRRLVADIDNPRVPIQLALDQIAAICVAVTEIEAALELLTAGQPFQPALPFDDVQPQRLLAAP